MLPAFSPDESRRRQFREMLTRPDNFGLAILLILMTIIVVAVGDGPAGQLASVALSGGTLLFVLHTAAASRRTFRFAAVVVTLAVLTAAGALIVGSADRSSELAGFVGLLLAGLAPLVILRRILISDRITFRLVLGALAIYLLLGLAYAYLYPIIGNETHQSFFVQTQTPTSADFLYFSYVTITTVGYGDFTAATSLGRMIAVSEALLGQLYLVSAVALLVSNIGRSVNRGDRGSDRTPPDPR